MEYLQDMFAEIRRQLVEIENNPQFKPPAAKVEVNAPLALIQMGLKGRHEALKSILAFWKLDFLPCSGCKTQPGEQHIGGCDWERCPLCGDQIIACPCVYEINGMSYDTLEYDHPAIYVDGPTPEMHQKFEQMIEEGPGWVLYMGDYHGSDFAASEGIYTRWGDKTPLRPEGGLWVRCDRSHPDASPGLNDAADISKWDSEKKREVRRDEVHTT